MDKIFAIIGISGLSLAVICLICLIVYAILLTNNTFYCKRYSPDEYNVFHSLINLHDSLFKLDFTYNNIYVFKCCVYPVWNITVSYDHDIAGYKAYVNHNETNKCIACSYYRKGSTKLAKKLLNIYKKQITNNNE